MTPLCTAAAAACLAKIYKQCRGRAAARAGWHVAAWPAAALTLAAVLLMSRSSHFNYPGAAALAHVRSMVRKTAPSLPTHADLPPKRSWHASCTLQTDMNSSTIHVEAYPAMSGVTRFQARALSLRLDKVGPLACCCCCCCRCCCCRVDKKPTSNRDKCIVV